MASSDLLSAELQVEFRDPITSYNDARGPPLNHHVFTDVLEFLLLMYWGNLFWVQDGMH